MVMAMVLRPCVHCGARFGWECSRECTARPVDSLARKTILRVALRADSTGATFEVLDGGGCPDCGVHANMAGSPNCVNQDQGFHTPRLTKGAVEHDPRCECSKCWKR